MIVDNALANFTFQWNVGSGDTGKSGVEHRNFLQSKSLNSLQELG
jgi:hypothetical protein